MRTKCLLHVFTRLWCLNVIVLHDLLVDFKSDLLKVLVLRFVKHVEVLLIERINHLLLLFPLDFTIEIMSNHCPDLLVHEKVLVSSESLRDLILESQVIDALTYE